MDINNILQQGGLTALAALGLYLVKVVVNDLKHDVAATRTATEQMSADLRRIAKSLDPKGDHAE